MLKQHYIRSNSNIIVWADPDPSSMKQVGMIKPDTEVFIVEDLGGHLIHIKSLPNDKHSLEGWVPKMAIDEREER